MWYSYMPKKWTEEETELLIRLYPNTSRQELSQILDRSEEGIKVKAMSLKLAKSDEFKKTHFQKNQPKAAIAASEARTRKAESFVKFHDCFSNIDSEEKAYWLGFLAADGHARKNDNGIILSIQKSDVDHLEKFKGFIQCSRAIRDRGDGTVTLNFSSSLMNKDLKRYGIKTDGVYSFCLPRLEPELMRHFIRGLIDGDGWVCLEKPRLGVVCNTQIANEIKVFIFSQTNVQGKTAQTHKCGLISFCIYGKNQVLFVANWLKKDASVLLERKWMLCD